MALFLRLRFVFIYFFFTCWLYAQQGFEYVLQLREENGLPDNSIRSIIQDAEGFIWLGMDEGVARYDGAQFVTLKHKPGDDTSIPDNRANALLSIGDQLWIGTPLGLAIMDLKTEKSSRKDLNQGNQFRVKGKEKIKTENQEELSQSITYFYYSPRQYHLDWNQSKGTL